MDFQFKYLKFQDLNNIFLQKLFNKSFKDKAIRFTIFPLQDISTLNQKINYLFLILVLFK